MTARTAQAGFEFTIKCRQIAHVTQIDGTPAPLRLILRDVFSDSRVFYQADRPGAPATRIVIP